MVVGVIPVLVVPARMIGTEGGIFLTLPMLAAADPAVLIEGGRRDLLRFWLGAGVPTLPRFGSLELPKWDNSAAGKEILPKMNHLPRLALPGTASPATGLLAMVRDEEIFSLARDAVGKHRYKRRTFWKIADRNGAHPCIRPTVIRIGREKGYLIIVETA